MKRASFLTVFVSLSCLFSFIENQVQSQFGQRNDNQVRVTGWTDDTHYIFQTLDAEKKPVTLNVDIRTGKGVPYTAPKSDRDLLNESLPKGFTLGFSDIISPDMKSAIFVKENDLYYFRAGDKELKQLTFDKVQKVNTRFSPDGSGENTILPLLPVLLTDRERRMVPRSTGHLPSRPAWRTTARRIRKAAGRRRPRRFSGRSRRPSLRPAASLSMLIGEGRLVGQVDHDPLAVLVPRGQVQQLPVGAAARRRRPTGPAPGATTPCGPGRSS